MLPRLPPPPRFVVNPIQSAHPAAVQAECPPGGKEAFPEGRPGRGVGVVAEEPEDARHGPDVRVTSLLPEDDVTELGANLPCGFLAGDFPEEPPDP